METKQYQIRFRDIDPDTGYISQDKLIALCETITSANWVMHGLHLTMVEDNDPNREIYMVDGGIILSPNDAKIFADALTNPPEPNEKLRKAVEDYKKKIE